MKYWYKDAVFYEVSVRAFQDSNGDGIGDLAGLTSRLDYLQDLGVTAVWLLPLSPSPMRDDGYDVSDYYGIHPMYGTTENFRTLVAEAHRRGLKIIVELIPNHTSDEHPWFQASHDPSHPEHARYRDYYVWSETDQRYLDARIIFLDTEKSNWTYDPLRKAYYWHRFFSHQPDLNYENPEVQREMLRVVQHWVDQGADAIRVDAPPYLFECEGTNCENLPETHAYLRRLRAFLDTYMGVAEFPSVGGDASVPGVMLLSEANQWPGDVRAYFGSGDEMHMNFHFPLMPRIFMAMRRADRSSLEWILEQTPVIPANCQWGTFLRCHDELTLEMVTPEEREWMWEQYAPDPRMRLNLGIRRRLAPLLDNDARKIALAYSLLLSMPGSPFLYYGDEIGMGDNIDLPDRFGLRTPMQWDATPNAGFSSAPAESLFTPVIAGEYGPEHVNVAAQRADPGSLYHTIRKMIAVRKAHPAFGWGDFAWVADTPLPAAAFHRRVAGEDLLILNNLSGKPISVEIQPSDSLVDLFTGDRIVPEQNEIHLEPYQFRWLSLVK